MKKIKILLLCVGFFLTSCDLFYNDVSGFFTLPSPEVIIPSKGLVYELIANEAKYTVTTKNPSNLSGDIFIAHTYEGKPVTQIKQNAFEDIDEISTVVLPSTITEIGASAFAGTKIKYVILPKSVTTIWATAFTNCQGSIYLEHDNFEGDSIDGNSVHKRKDWHKVTFHAMEGSNVPAMPILIEDNTIKELPEPKREGYDFQGWYLSSTNELYNTRISVNDSVDKDITVYAKWTLK